MTVGAGEHCFLLTDPVNTLHYGNIVEHFA